MIDVDECMSVDCGVDGECTNTLGSFTCDCDPGYVANKSNICVGRCNTEIVNGVAWQGNFFLCFPVKNNLATSNVLRYSMWIAQQTFCVKPRGHAPLTHGASIIIGPVCKCQWQLLSFSFNGTRFKVLLGWFSNRTGTSVDDGVRKSNNWLDQWQSGKLGTGSRV